MTAHIYQYRGGLGGGSHFSALPEEMDAWMEQPWWKRTRRKTELHFLQREKELEIESGRGHADDEATFSRTSHTEPIIVRR